MVRDTACRSVLIAVLVLLVCTALGSAQRGTRRQQEPRDVTGVPAPPTAFPAERRVALVIGNGQYQYVPRLDNPSNDARLIAETLAALGFTLVGGQAQLDLDKTAFDHAVQEFGNVIQGAGVALFYYAGHGMQIQGANYLVPIRANPVREADIDFQLLNVDLILRQMGFARTRLNLVILDACRNHPFAGRGLRATGGGLAQMRAPEGTLIAFATQPGNVALDGTDGHSPYTRALANAIRKPGLDVFAVFNETGLEVKNRTGDAQQPWVSTSPIEGQFYFAGAPAQQPTGGKDEAVEIAFWNSVKDDKTPDAFRTYLASYPQGKFAALARLKLKQLTETPKPAPSSSAPETLRPTPPHPAVGPQVAVGVAPQPPQTQPPPATSPQPDAAPPSGPVGQKPVEVAKPEEPRSQPAPLPSAHRQEAIALLKTAIDADNVAITDQELRYTLRTCVQVSAPLSRSDDEFCGDVQHTISLSGLTVQKTTAQSWRGPARILVASGGTVRRDILHFSEPPGGRRFRIESALHSGREERGQEWIQLYAGVSLERVAEALRALSR